MGLMGAGVGGAGTDVAVGGTGVAVGDGRGVWVGDGTGVGVAGGGNGVLDGKGGFVGKIGVSVGTGVSVGGNGVGVKVGCGTRVGSGRGTRAWRAPQAQLRDTDMKIIGSAMYPPTRKYRTILSSRWILSNGLSPCRFLLARAGKRKPTPRGRGAHG